MSGKLFVLAGPLCGEALPLDPAGTTIGRDPNLQLSIPDRLMSRRHCAIDLVDGRFLLRDLGSSNGTYVNGMPIQEHILDNGDRIRAGDSILLFLDTDARGTATRPAVPAGATADDLTSRIERADRSAERHAERSSDSPGAIVAEVLAGRVALQAHDLIGDSVPMRAVYERIRKVAPADSSVLIHGETGTGKELAARAIHENSPRARRPFVAVNCAALTESLLESELFGHERGAFTGAVALKKGKFEIADGGTLFLDEVGELAPGLQAKFLRALQHHAFERVGGTRTVQVNVRVVAATNSDLEAAVSAGRFRQDLWYRLNVVSLTMPPLRARRTDIPLLAVHFAAKYSRGRPVTVSPDALDVLRAYDWPGNVRELENAIERAVVLGESDRIVPEDLPEGLLEAATASAGGAGALYHQSVLAAKRRLILDAIDQSGGNYTAAARLLGINPTYLHRLIRNLQLREVASRPR